MKLESWGEKTNENLYLSLIKSDINFDYKHILSDDSRERERGFNSHEKKRDIL